MLMLMLMISGISFSCSPGSLHIYKTAAEKEGHYQRIRIRYSGLRGDEGVLLTVVLDARFQ